MELTALSSRAIATFLKLLCFTILRWEHFLRRFSRTRGPNCIKFGGHRVIVDSRQIDFRFQISCCISKRWRLKGERCQKLKLNFALVIPCKINLSVKLRANID